MTFVDAVILTYSKPHKVFTEEVVEYTVSESTVIEDGCNVSTRFRVRNGRKSGLTLINNIHVGQPVSVSAHDGIDVGFHDILELSGVGDVLDPWRELGVPDEIMSPDDRAGLGSLFEDLTVRCDYDKGITATRRTKSAPVQLKTPRSAWITSHFISFSGVYWLNSPSRIGSNLSSAR
jgi:hypothetical protein